MRDSEALVGSRTVISDLSSCEFFTQRSWVEGHEDTVVEVSMSMDGNVVIQADGSLVFPPMNLAGLIEMLASLFEQMEKDSGLT